MLKFKVMSDLHLDVNKQPFVDETPEDSKEIVLGLLGDLAEVNSLKILSAFLHDICPKYKTVLYVFGNHEYYNGSIDRAEAKLLEVVGDIDNLTILNRKSVIIEDVKFIGATLWTDLDKDNPLFKLAVSDKYRGLNDYKKIRHGTTEAPYMYRLRPDKVLGMHSRDLDFIKKELTYDTRKTVVLTHHAPCLSILAKGKYGNHSLNPAYASHLEEFIAYSEIDLWAHGHVHDPYDVDFFDTRITNNTRGYDESESKNFNPNKIIEL